MKKFSITLAALVAFTAVQAQAEVVVEDTDGNGTFSMAEMQAAYPALTEEGFADIDVNADGEVDSDEMEAAAANGLLPE